MTYTMIDNPVIDRKIQADMDLIKERVVGLLGKNLHSLLLCGGFGRGEGSVTIKDNVVHIVNDYDFTVVLRAETRLQYMKLYKQYHPQLERLAGELAAILHMKQVDLSPKPMSYFTSPGGLRIENYEVKMGNRLIHGKENPTSWMPAWTADSIPLFEGTWLFRNRGLGLIIAALYMYGKDQIEDRHRENFIVECTKAHLAMGDAALLYKRSYHHRYSERLAVLNRTVLSDIPGWGDVKNRYENAINQKLYPDFSRYDAFDFKSWWFDIRDAFERFFIFYEQQRLRWPFQTWTEYAELSKPEDRLSVKSIAGKILRSGFSLSSIPRILKRSKPSFSVALVALTLFSLKRGGADQAMLGKAASMLGITLQGSPYENWLTVAKAVINDIHPGGEAGKIIAETNPRPSCVILNDDGNLSLS